jgi:NAD-dependent SIR2 family protein deacetylase
LHKFNLPYPEAIFELQYYRKNPLAFITLAKDLWPTGQRYKPTISHSFMKLLDSKGILLRVYTQNIDGLELLAGVPPERLVKCHGHFSSASCIDCGESYDIEKCRMEMLNEPPIVPTCLKCGVQGTANGRVKPDIVFFGEELPQRFSSFVDIDTGKCDLLLILGTSLQVYPVASIPQLVDCPVVLFNREDLNSGKSFWNGIKNVDIFEKGDCDARLVNLYFYVVRITHLFLLHVYVENTFLNALHYFISIKTLCSKIGLLDELENIHNTTLRQLGGDS